MYLWKWQVFKNIINESVIVCDVIITVTNKASQNVTNTILTNVTSTVSLNSDDKKVSIKCIAIFCTQFY